MLCQPPVTTQPTDQPVTRTPVAPIPRKPVVLVAEDSADMRSLLTDVLESEGCEVVAVPSGARAVSEMNVRPPDLVITDLFMPGMSGFALRALMLKRADLSAIPVIVLSAYWHRPSETLEVADVITKPINIDRLIDSVRRLVPAMKAENA